MQRTPGQVVAWRDCSLGRMITREQADWEWWGWMESCGGAASEELRVRRE